MPRVPIEQTVIVASLVVMLLIHCSSAGPRRRFCEIHPFAPRCLGVAAKRSAQRLDLQNRLTSSEFLSSLLRRIYNEEMTGDHPGQQPTVQDKWSLYDDPTFLDDLSNMVRARNKNLRTLQQTAFINDNPAWEETFDSSKDQL